MPIDTEFPIAKGTQHTPITLWGCRQHALRRFGLSCSTLACSTEKGIISSFQSKKNRRGRSIVIGGSPIAGWFISGKILSIRFYKWMITRATPFDKKRWKTAPTCPIHPAWNDDRLARLLWKHGLDQGWDHLVGLQIGIFSSPQRVEFVLNTLGIQYIHLSDRGSKVR